MANALFERRFERDLRKKNKRRSMRKEWFRTTLNQFKKQPFQPDALFDTEIGRRSNVHQKGFYNQITMGYKPGTEFNFYKKETQLPIQSEIRNLHCVKSVQMQSYFWSVFSCVRTRIWTLFTQCQKANTCLSSSKGTVHQDSGGYISFWTDKAFFLQLENVTSGKSILSMVKELELNFLSEPVQNRFPKSMNMSKKAKMLVENEIQRLLRKEAITRTNYCKNKFVSNHFLREKKDARYRPISNLKSLYQLLPYYHFKMEDLKNRKK